MTTRSLLTVTHEEALAEAVRVYGPDAYVETLESSTESRCVVGVFASERLTGDARLADCHLHSVPLQTFDSLPSAVSVMRGGEPVPDACALMRALLRA